MWVDRVPVSTVLAARLATPGLPTVSQATHRFWSTPPRAADDISREILQVTLTDRRLINYLSVELPHFPLTAQVEWQDPDTLIWYPLLSADSSLASPISYQISDSVPSRVDVVSAQGADHPQHYGPGHWVYVSWRCRSVTARAVRLVLQRFPSGSPPTDHQDRRVPYSLGARGLQVGYRITSLADVPRYGDIVTGAEDFSSSTDLLGSRVSFSLRHDGADSVLTPVDGDYWRSAPQPVSYAVVNLYTDTRAADGQGQIIDRWYIDPLTVGAHCNLYYSNDEPDVTFAASDTGLGYPLAQAHGGVTMHYLLPRPIADHLDFDHLAPSYVDVDNAYLQFDPRTGSWWIGVEAMSLYYGADGIPADDPGQDPHHPVLSFGGCTLRVGAGVLEFSNDSGQLASIDLDPAQGVGSVWRAAVVFNPADTADYPAGLTLLYRLGLGPVSSVTWEMRSPAARPAVFRLGGYPSDIDPGISGLALRALILKVVPAGPDVAQFMDDAAGFVHRPAFSSDDDGSTDGSTLRLDVTRASVENSPFGLFGGPGNRYTAVEWTPLCRDYTLKRGFLHLPPTRAKYWKFEFTGLIGEPYESFVPIKHTVQVFSTDTVRRYASAQSPTNPGSGGPGATSMLRLDAVNRYADALAVLRSLPVANQHGPTEVLYAAGLANAARLRAQGWIWSFTPWHIGSSAPQFVTRTRHTYETITVQHRTKVAFFAGVKSLRAYRLDHLPDDDTPVYLDFFGDDRWIDTAVGVVPVEGGLLSLTGRGEVVSKPMGSRRAVAAIQYASVQSDAVQVLPDDRFTDDDFDAHWLTYGDAEVVPGSGQVQVERGWRQRTYGDLEIEPWIDYATLEGHLYGELEGALPSGVSGGGIRSLPIDVSGSGRIYVAVRASAPGPLSQPLTVQILASEGDYVLASAQLGLTAGAEGTATAGYTPGSASVALTYGALEAGTYGALEGTTYGSHESTAITGSVYVQVVQLGPTHDSFTVTRLSLFDLPVQWAFSVDDGVTWYDAYEVRNHPHGVLSLPASGTALRWRARTFRAGASISALSIRPWYSGILGSHHHHGGSVSGPNRSVVDQLPPVEADPMWQQWANPVPRWWFDG